MRGSIWIVIIALLGAAVIASSGHDGWGWCIFIAFTSLVDSILQRQD